MSKKFEIVNGDISDGYHTFNELYEHRVELFLALCRQRSEDVYWYEHYDGWPCVTLKTEHGQISYHVPMSRFIRFTTVFRKVSKEHGESMFDGHTSGDVLSRLRMLSQSVG